MSSSRSSSLTRSTPLASASRSRQASPSPSRSLHGRTQSNTIASPTTNLGNSVPSTPSNASAATTGTPIVSPSPPASSGTSRIRAPSPSSRMMSRPPTIAVAPTKKSAAAADRAKEAAAAARQALEAAEKARAFLPTTTFGSPSAAAAPISTTTITQQSTPTAIAAPSTPRGRSRPTNTTSTTGTHSRRNSVSRSPARVRSSSASSRVSPSPSPSSSSAAASGTFVSSNPPPSSSSTRSSTMAHNRRRSNSVQRMSRDMSEQAAAAAAAIARAAIGSPSSSFNGSATAAASPSHRRASSTTSSPALKPRRSTSPSFSTPLQLSSTSKASPSPLSSATKDEDERLNRVSISLEKENGLFSVDDAALLNVSGEGLLDLNADSTRSLVEEVERAANMSNLQRQQAAATTATQNAASEREHKLAADSNMNGSSGKIPSSSLSVPVAGSGASKSPLKTSTTKSPMRNSPSVGPSLSGKIDSIPIELTPPSTPSSAQRARVASVSQVSSGFNSKNTIVSLMQSSKLPHSFSDDFSTATDVSLDDEGTSFHSDASHQNGTVGVDGSGKGVETSVQVCVRVRPLNAMEMHTSQQIAWGYSSSNSATTGAARHTITQLPIPGYSSAPAHSSGRTSALLPAFTFDHLFTPESTNAEIFDEIGRKLIQQVMAGYPSTLFAYGQTSSGKTHSIHGATHDPGMIPLSVQAIFDTIEESTDREFVLRVAYLEVYNELVNDLLNPLATNLTIRESSDKGIVVEGLKECVVVSPDQVFALLSSGEAQRVVGKTNYNEISSRSHTIFQMTVESSVRGSATQAIRTATLNLVDLAGSENAIKAGTGTVRVKETGYINRSLLTLGHVIYKLSESGRSGANGAPSLGHIPYRDSKLTRLLQNSLSLSACVSVICTISPSSGNIEETLSTLKFARRAKRIKTAAVVNEVLPSDASSVLLRKYQEEIERLKRELAAWKLRHAQQAQTLLRSKASSPTNVPRDNNSNNAADPASGDKPQRPKPLSTGTNNAQTRGNGDGEDEEDDEESVYAQLDLDQDDDSSQAKASATGTASANALHSPSHSMSNGGNLNENALTAQIEQLTRLILTSSQAARVGGDSDETAGGESLLVSPPPGSEHSRIPQPNSYSSPNAASSSTISKMNGASTTPPQNKESLTPTTQRSRSLVGATNASPDGSVAVPSSPSTNTLSFARKLSVNSLIQSVSHSVTPSMPNVDSSLLPSGANATFYPTSLNPLSNWTRSQLETHYMNLLTSYTSTLQVNQELMSASSSFDGWRTAMQNKQRAAQGRFQAMALPLMQRIQQALHHPQPGTLAQPNHTAPSNEKVLLKESAHLLSELADLLSSSASQFDNSNNINNGSVATPLAPNSPVASGVDVKLFHELAHSISASVPSNSLQLSVPASPSLTPSTSFSVTNSSAPSPMLSPASSATFSALHSPTLAVKPQ